MHKSLGFESAFSRIRVLVFWGTKEWCAPEDSHRHGCNMPHSKRLHRHLSMIFTALFDWPGQSSSLSLSIFWCIFHKDVLNLFTYVHSYMKIWSSFAFLLRCISFYLLDANSIHLHLQDHFTWIYCIENEAMTRCGLHFIKIFINRYYFICFDWWMPTYWGADWNGYYLKILSTG